MDPDTTLKDMLDVAHALQDGDALSPVDAADDLATFVIELDHWIRKGGSLPSAWKGEV